MFTSVLKSRMLKTVVIALFLFSAFYQVSEGADHIIPSQWKMEEYFWRLVMSFSVRSARSAPSVSAAL